MGWVSAAFEQTCCGAEFAGDLERPERVAAAAAADDVAMAGPTAAAALAAEKHWWVYSKQNEPLLLGIVTALLHLILLRVHC